MRLIGAVQRIQELPVSHTHNSTRGRQEERRETCADVHQVTANPHRHPPVAAGLVRIGGRQKST